MLPFRRSTAAGRDRGAFPSPEGRSVCFPSPARAVVKVLYKLAPLYFQRAPTEAFPPERSDATLLYNPWHRGPSGPMDAICPSAAQRQAPTGIQPPRRLVFIAIGNTYYAYRDPSLALRMTVDGGAPRSRSSILEPRSQPLRGCHQRKNIITDSTTTKSTTAAYII